MFLIHFSPELFHIYVHASTYIYTAISYTRDVCGKSAAGVYIIIIIIGNNPGVSLRGAYYSSPPRRLVLRLAHVFANTCAYDDVDARIRCLWRCNMPSARETHKALYAQILATWRIRIYFCFRRIELFVVSGERVISSRRSRVACGSA